jgi:hypothetical protein
VEQIYSTGQVARMLGIQGYQIAYAINTRQIAEASFRFLDKRCFTARDIQRVAEHFGMTQCAPHPIEENHQHERMTGVQCEDANSPKERHEDESSDDSEKTRATNDHLQMAPGSNVSR